jgi:hypothetical protein
MPFRLAFSSPAALRSHRVLRMAALALGLLAAAARARAQLIHLEDVIPQLPARVRG